MNRKIETVFTHYTKITEAKQIDVRRMQSEVAFSLFRAIGAKLGQVFKQSPHDDGVHELDQA